MAIWAELLLQRLNISVDYDRKDEGARWVVSEVYNRHQESDMQNQFAFPNLFHCLSVLPCLQSERLSLRAEGMKRVNKMGKKCGYKAEGV